MPGPLIPFTYSDTPGTGGVSNWQEQMQARIDRPYIVDGKPVQLGVDQKEAIAALLALRKNPQLAQQLLRQGLDSELNDALGERIFWNKNFIGQKGGM